MTESDAERTTAMRYTVERWAPTQPTPTLDHVVWLRESVVTEDLFDLAKALTELAHAAEEHHQTSVEIAYVAEEVMRRLTAATRVLPPAEGRS